MLPDVLSVITRALSFVCSLQAAGIAVFLAMFARDPELASPLAAAIRRTGVWLAGAAVALVLTHYALESARMAGDLAGVWDLSLQRFVAASSTALAAGLRVLGLALVALYLRPRPWSAAHAWLGALLVAASFAATGHTVSAPHRWGLAGLLLLHLIVIEFWFGALLPLLLITRRAPELAAAAIRRFTRIATALVPLILVAGLAMAYLLLPDLNALREPYGQLLLIKGAGFAVLMALAALNKWRLAPGLAAGNPAAARGFRRSVSAEYLLIVLVLATTAVMTALFSPER